MGVLETITAESAVLEKIFEDLHTHPELGFQENRTAKIVAARLTEIGVDEVHEGIGGTGVVALIKGTGGGNRRVGLRADMDALPITETTGLAYASTTPGVMHACGHDGHTTMLLGAAEYLAKTRGFDGTAVLIFQPAEEGLGGARAMLADNLFQRFPCDEAYGLHNNPMSAPGTATICKGTAMAGAEFFDISIAGTGSHAAMPHQSRDSVVAAGALIGALQTVVSRNVAPLDACVFSITQVHAGSAYNVVPGEAALAGTIRYFKDSVKDLAQRRMDEICQGLGVAHGVQITVQMQNIFDVLINDTALSDAYLEAAKDVLGEANATEITQPMTGSEDFADMLKVVPGAYISLGHSGTAALHNPNFVLGKESLPHGAALLARVVEKRLPLG